MSPLHWTNDDHKSVAKPTWLIFRTKLSRFLHTLSTKEKHWGNFRNVSFFFCNSRLKKNFKIWVILSIDNKLGTTWIKAVVACFKPLQNQSSYKHFAFFKICKLLEKVLLVRCQNVVICQDNHEYSRSQWPRGLRLRSAAARLLRLWVRIPWGAWMFVCCECCVLSGKGLCDELITCPEKSYRLWCVVVCDLETSRMGRPWPALGCSATKKHVYKTYK